MTRIKKFLKDPINNKIFKVFSNIAFLGAMAFFILNHTFLTELKFILESAQIKNVESLMFHMFMPFKAFTDISQLISLTIFILKVVLAIIAIPLIVYLFCKTIKLLFICVNTKQLCFKSRNYANLDAVYIVQSKFIC